MSERKKILLVEDNPDNHRLAERILSREGYEVVICENGSSALQFCQQQVPDLILVDISLPEIDGLEVTRLLRARREFGEVPIIALSAHCADGFAANSLDAGCNAFVPKPLSPSGLIQEVKKYIT